MKTGYRGPISLEAFNDHFRGAPAAMIAQDGMRALQIAGERLDKDREAQGLAPLRIGVQLPEASPIGGIEFVEFTTGSSGPSSFVNLLEGLGFTRVARHRSKDVDLYRLLAAADAHLGVHSTVLTEAAGVLRERFAIDHATIQVEPRSAHACWCA